MIFDASSSPPPRPAPIEDVGATRCISCSQPPVLRTSILFWGAASVIPAGLISALVVHVTRDVGLPDSDLGLLLTAFGVGTVVGALLASRIRHGPAWPQLLGGNAVRGGALIGIGLASQMAIMALLAFVAGTVSSLILIAYITLRAAYSPDALLGRVGSTARTISLGMQPVGMLAAGFAIDLTSELAVCVDVLGFSDDDLRRVTSNALDASFVDDAAKDDVRRRHFGWVDA